MSNGRIKINTSPVAGQYASPRERIVEVSSPGGGCLISFTERGGELVIGVYRADPTVRVPRPAYDGETPTPAAFVEALAYPWQPGVGVVPLRIGIGGKIDVDIDKGLITRDSIEAWITTPDARGGGLPGDYSGVEDFRAVVNGVEVPWRDGTSAATWDALNDPDSTAG